MEVLVLAIAIIAYLWHRVLYLLSANKQMQEAIVQVMADHETSMQAITQVRADLMQVIDEQLWDVATNSRETAIELIDRATNANQLTCAELSESLTTNIDSLKESHEHANIRHIQFVKDVASMMKFERARERQSAITGGYNHSSAPIYGFAVFDHSYWMSKACLTEMCSWFVKTLPEFTNRHFNWFVNEYICRRYVHPDTNNSLYCKKLQLGVSLNYYQLPTDRPLTIKDIDNWDIVLSNNSAPLRTDDGWSIFKPNLMINGNQYLPKSLTTISAQYVVDNAFSNRLIHAPRISVHENSISVYQCSVLMPHIIQYMYSQR
jgi:hypothetical protein